MQSARRLRLLLAAGSFVLGAFPAFAQRVIATIPVDIEPQNTAVDSTTNTIYVVTNCGSDPDCAGNGTVTVIDGATNGVASVSVGTFPNAVAVNSVTHKAYVVNSCADPSCIGFGTVTVIDGVTLATTTVTVGSDASGVAVNPVTNKIYVTNQCGSDLSCNTYTGSVTVIDGVTLATTSVAVGSTPSAPVVNPVTNKIYVANACGNDPTCNAPSGTVTVIDGATRATTTVSVGSEPVSADVNPLTNKVYVVNACGGDPSCGGNGTVTVIDGATLTTASVPTGLNPNLVAVNPATNKIYVLNQCTGSCQNHVGSVTVIDGTTLATSQVGVEQGPLSLGINSAANKIYVLNYCGIVPPCLTGAVTVIDGATLATTNVGVGAGSASPVALGINSVTNRVYVPNFFDNTVSVVDGTPPPALQFVSLAPCRVVDTRDPDGPFGGPPISGHTSRSFPLSQGNCNIPATAAAYSLNVTVVPPGRLGYLTIWPSGQRRPVVSTMNSLDGRIKANAALVPAGSSGAVSVYVSDTSNVVLDIDGYFAPVGDSTLAFYPLTPCRVVDTRNPNGDLAGPFLNGNHERDFPVLESACIPPGVTPAAYSFNFTVVPHPAGQRLGYLTVWPAGDPRPTVSTLNNPTGTIVANAALVPAGLGGEVAVYPSGNTDLVIDINGYFAPADTGGLSLYAVPPCRVLDTRLLGGAFSGTLPVPVAIQPCGISSLAHAFVLNGTVVPAGTLGYLTLWPDGEQQPVASTLNATDGAITSNMAIVPTDNGSIDAFASALTDLVLDIFSYFAP